MYLYKFLVLLKFIQKTLDSEEQSTCPLEVWLWKLYF